jgi:GT2 family glycosyltransferase
VAIINDDVELDCAWLERTTVLLDERADLSFCCGKIYRADGRTIDNAGDALSMGGGAWRLGFGRADAPEFDLPRPLRAISMTASLFRRKAFEKLGGLDEDFISYLEDIDLSIRAWRAGFRGIYLPRAVARHQGSATAGGPESPLVFEHLTRNQLLLMVKHYPLVLWLRLALRIGWAQLLWAGMAIRKGLLGAYLRGGMGFYLLLPRMIRKRVPWRRGETKEFLAWLRESEEAIYADISSRPRSEQDTYWRMYFLLFPPRARAAVASKPGLGRLPSR